MKHRLFCLLFLVLKLAMGQSDMETDFTAEGIEHIIGYTEFIENEPINIMSKNNPFKKKYSTKNTFDHKYQSLNLCLEIILNETGKIFILPLNYKIWDVNFFASVPYFLKKTIKYSLKNSETSGLGDISLGLGYSKVFWDTYFFGEFTVKLPTGDSKATNDNFLVPLGTGSTDYLFWGIVSKDLTETFSLATYISYKINTSSKKKAEILNPEDESKITYIDYEITNGNFLKLSTSFDYYPLEPLLIETKLTLKNIGEGSSDKRYSYSWKDEVINKNGRSNKQNATMLDLSLKAEYSFLLFTISGGVRIPLYTNRNKDNREGNRSITIFTKFDYPIL